MATVPSQGSTRALASEEAAVVAVPEAQAPGLDEPAIVPPGRTVDLPGRGRTFVRDVAGPPGAPTVLLLHGLAATGAINWLSAFPPLSNSFRVIAPDLRGHGRGLRFDGGFSLADCADDVAALADDLDLGPSIVVGYSMGGPVAQLVWKRHRGLVDGLVLVATSFDFASVEYFRIAGTALFEGVLQATRWAEMVGRLPLGRARALLPNPAPAPATASMGRWAAREIRRTDVRAVLEAIRAVGAYDAGDWVGRVDVPTAVVLTTKDRAVHPLTQLRLAKAVPGATVHAVAGGHTCCGHPLFAQVLAEACGDVADRIEHGPGA